LQALQMLRICLFGLAKRQLPFTLGAILLDIDKILTLLYYSKMTERIKIRIQIQEIINKIESGIFSENDIGMLYIGLRQILSRGASPEENCVYELSNFFAHGDERDKGIILNSFMDFYYVIFYLVNYTLERKNIDLTKTFPSNIKDMCLNKLNRMDKEEVKKIFSDNKYNVKQLIEKAIVIDESDNAHIDKSSPKIIYSIISILFNKIPTEPIFTDDSIIKCLLKVMDINKIKYNKKYLLKQQDKIILSLLTHIHHTELKNELAIKINCHIYYNISTNHLSLNLGYLLPNDECMGFVYEAISTKLILQNNCSNDFLEKHNIFLQKRNGSIFNSELGLNGEFKIEEKKIVKKTAPNEAVENITYDT
jgi:hypothetical protein